MKVAQVGALLFVGLASAGAGGAGSWLYLRPTPPSECGAFTYGDIRLGMARKDVLALRPLGGCVTDNLCYFKGEQRADGALETQLNVAFDARDMVVGFDVGVLDCTSEDFADSDACRERARD